jgi:hypothetical protein
MRGKTCRISVCACCGTPLGHRQSGVCSQECSDALWTDLREEEDSLPPWTIAAVEQCIAECRVQEYEEEAEEISETTTLVGLALGDAAREFALSEQEDF